MTYIRTGTIAANNGSQVITGAGTRFITDQVLVGDAIYIGDDGTPYDVTSVNSQTSIGIAIPYRGVTGSGKSYVVMPVQGHNHDLAMQARELLRYYRDGVVGAEALTEVDRLVTLAGQSAALAKGYSESAQATVTGDMGSLVPAVGKMPIARANGTIDSRWIDSSEAVTVARATWDMATDTWTGNPHATSVHKSMRRCVINNLGEVQYYLGEFDSTVKETGEPAVLDGTDGEVAVEVNPVYVRVTFDGVSKITRETCAVELAGFELHPAFEGNVEKVYIGAYQATVFSAASADIIDGLNSDNNTARVNQTNDRLASTAGNFCMVGLTRPEFRKLAQNGGYQMFDYWQWQLLQHLFATEYGSHNSQLKIGNGNVAGAYLTSSDLQSDSPHIVNGLSNSLGNRSGAVGTCVSYRGVENPWGNAWQYIDGVNIDERQLYVSNDEDAYSDVIAGQTALGAPLPETGYIKTWQLVREAMVPAVTGAGASSTAFVGDQLYTATGLRAVRVGGGADHGALAGLSCCHGALAASSRGRAFSSRISKKLHRA